MEAGILRSMTRLAALLGVSRAPFLALPVTLVACGAGAAAMEGGFSWNRTFLALVGLVALHMAVNIFNEVSDYRTGIDLETRPTPFSGGSGTLPEGRLSPRAALMFGVVCAAVGLGIGIWFLVRVGWPLVPLVAVGGAVVLTYTDVLARIGLGEVAAGLGLGALPVVGTVLVQEGRIGPVAVAASLPAFFMTFDLLLLNEFPDEEADRRGGRRNLVLLLGRRRAAALYVAAVAAVPLALLGGVALGALPPAALLAAIPTALAVPAVRWALTRPEEPVPVSALGGNVVWNLATNLALGFVLAAVSGLV